MGTSIISTMENCKNPLHYVIFVITQHSENLYRTVNNLMLMSKDQPANENVEFSISFSDDGNLCWCSVDDDKE